MRASNFAKLTAFSAIAFCLGIVGAEAHVKWFCAYSIAGQPEGLGNVLCQDFESLSLLAIGVLFAGAVLDRTFVGVALTRALNRITGGFRAEQRSVRARLLRLLLRLRLVARRRHLDAGTDDDLALHSLDAARLRRVPRVGAKP